MAKSAGIIEINGNRYDVVSGQLVGAAKKVAAQVKSPASGVIDGLVRKPALSIVSSVKSAKAPSKSVPTASQSRPKGLSARRQTQRSQTLMRSLVSRPSRATKKIEGTTKLHKSRTALISPIRAGRAKTVYKNSQINRFGKSRAKAAITPLIATQALTPRASASKTAAAALPTTTLGSISHQHLERLLDHALIQADAHKLALRSRAKGWRRVFMAPKWLTIGTASLAVLLLVGFFAWQNVPQISMRVAATKAHVDASVPAYAPMGYGVAGPTKADDNQVTINYKAATQQAKGSYAITQQASNWDSSSVAANAVPTGTQVQSSQVNGTTVYIYGQNNNATWVNHGVLFNLQDKANLSSDQILKIAGGL